MWYTSAFVGRVASVRRARERDRGEREEKGAEEGGAHLVPHPVRERSRRRACVGRRGAKFGLVLEGGGGGRGGAALSRVEKGGGRRGSAERAREREREEGKRREASRIELPSPRSYSMRPHPCHCALGSLPSPSLPSAPSRPLNPSPSPSRAVVVQDGLDDLRANGGAGRGWGRRTCARRGGSRRWRSR